jgi:hypothetical protein
MSKTNQDLLNEIAFLESISIIVLYLEAIKAKKKPQNYRVTKQRVTRNNDTGESFIRSGNKLVRLTQEPTKVAKQSKHRKLVNINGVQYKSKGNSLVNTDAEPLPKQCILRVFNVAFTNAIQINGVDFIRKGQKLVRKQAAGTSFILN